MAQQEPRGLDRNAIGLTEVLFQSITFMAPAVAVALSIGYAIGLSFAGMYMAVWFTQREKVRSVREAMGEVEEPGAAPA
jgi:hypothetical protein